MTPLNDHWRDCGLEPRATLAFSRFHFSRTYGCLKPLWASTAGSRLHRHCDDSRPWCQRHREEEAALPYSKRAWSRRQESNLQPEIYKNSVLPVELRRQIRRPDWMGETSARRPPSASITWERRASTRLTPRYGSASALGCTDQFRLPASPCSTSRLYSFGAAQTAGRAKDCTARAWH